MSSSIHTPLISLPTPLLNTPQNKLFTPHSFKQHSHPTLHTPYNPASIRFVPPNPSSPFSYLKTIREPHIRRINKNPASSLQPPSSAPNPILPLLPKTHPTTPKSGDSTKISSKFAFFVFIFAFSQLNIKKYEEVCIFFFKFRLVLVGFRILCYRILKSEGELLLRISWNPVRSYFLGFHGVRKK